MENKKTKLTISGSAKKTIKNIDIAKVQGKKSVVIEKSKNNFVKSFEILKKMARTKVNSQIVSQILNRVFASKKWLG